MSFFRSLRSSGKSASSDDDDGLSPPSSAVGAATTPKAADGGDAAQQQQPTDESSPSSPASPPPAPIVPSNVDDMNIKVEDEPKEDPVRAGLEKEVRQRDGTISALEKARAEKHQELQKIERELEEERMQQMKEALVHKIESERIKRQTAHAEERLKALEHDMQDKAAIHEYANLIKGVAPKGGVDAQYVQKLQAQLQKAVKKMEATTEEMKALEDGSREVVDQLTAEIAQLVEERCRTELELRKQMDVLQEQKRDTQLEYEKRIRDNLKTLQALRAKAASQVTIDELEAELEESEAKLEELNRIHEKQAKTIEQLNKTLAAEGGL
jgi:chromosome segregation ATPase